jgi:PAS domain S-box-containing protein
MTFSHHSAPNSPPEFRVVAVNSQSEQRPPGVSNFCRALVEHAPLPMAMVEGDGHIVRYVNPAFCRLFEKPSDQLVGIPFCDMLPQSIECAVALDRVYSTGKPESHTEQEHSKPDPLFWSFTMWPTSAGEFSGAIMIQVTKAAQSYENTLAMNEALMLGSLRQHELTEAAELSNAQLQKEIADRKIAEEVSRRWEYIFNHAGWAVVTADAASNRIIMANPAFAQLHGWTVEEMIGTPLADTLAVGARAEFPGHVERANNQDDYIYEALHLRKDGTVFPALTHVSALKDAEGELLYRAATVRDITELKQAEQRQLLLTDELAHRGKNLLAVIVSIAARSLSGKRPLAEAREVLIQRLHALGRSQSLLINASFEGAPLGEVVSLEFESFSDRVKAVGPHVMLNPKVAQTFALVVHELSTNAAKYGALSLPEGHVAIRWSIEGVGADAKFKFQWQEFDGPPIVPPARRGFGRTLLENAVAQEFGGPPKISFASDGLRYEIEAPLSVVAAAGTQERIRSA